MPYSQNAWYGWMSLVVRTCTSPEVVAKPLRQAIQAVDPAVAFDGISLMEDRVSASLGAQSSDVLRTVLQQGLITILTGITAGIVGVFILSRLIEGFLFGIAATDPATVILVATLLSATAFLACYLPARFV